MTKSNEWRMDRCGLGLFTPFSQVHRSTGSHPSMRTNKSFALRKMAGRLCMSLGENLEERVLGLYWMTKTCNIVP